MCLGFYYKPCWDLGLRQASKGKNFSFKGKTFTVKVVDVYDGDTITVIMRRFGNLEQYRVRLMGFDSPEMKPPRNHPNREQEINAARKSKNALKNRIEESSNSVMLLQCHGWDKYGRILGTLWLPRCFYKCRWRRENINDYMIRHNYGYRYDGGTKKIPSYSGK